MLRRRGGPGLLNTMARTAVIAGTATAVSNKVNARAAGRAQAAHQQAQQQQAQMQEELAAQETVIEAVDMARTIEKLKELAQLKDAGMLTDEEFALAKSKVLAG